MRTPTVPPWPGSPLNTWPPHCAQNDFESPSGGRHVRSSSAPATTSTPSAPSVALVVHIAPLRRRQRWQWQWPAESKGAVTWKRTVPQAQEPCSGSSGEGMSGSVPGLRAAPRPRARARRRAAVAGSSRRATTSSSSSWTAGSSCSEASSARRSRCVAIPSTSASRLRRRRSSSRPSSTTKARCSASRSASSSTPSPRAASVLTIGTRQPGSGGASERTPRISRTIVSVRGWSALLTTITSGISITPAFSAWMESPEPGISTSTTVSAWSMTSTSAWPDADRLEEHVVLARGVHEQRRLERGLRHAAERAARGHGADEHAGVEEVLGQPDPVAEQRAAAERGARVDREHADRRARARAGGARARRSGSTCPRRAGR